MVLLSIEISLFSQYNEYNLGNRSSQESEVAHMKLYYMEQIIELLNLLDETQLNYVNAFIRERFSME